MTEEQTVQLLQDLVRRQTDSGDHAAQEALQGFVADLVAASARNVRVRRSGPGEYPWTLLTAGAGDGPVLLFACHVDTVPVGEPARWSQAPFAARIADGRLYGRGSTDMKGGLAAAVAALLEADRLGRNVGLLMTADEEIGSLGAPDAAAGLAGLDLGAVIIPEATQNRIVLGHRGALWLRVTAEGLAAHGSTPERGVNAALKLADVLVRAGKELPLGADGFLGPETWNLGTFSSGTAPNIVPDAAEAVIDMRIAGEGTTLLQWWQSQPEISGVDVLLALPALRSSVDGIEALAAVEVDSSPAPYFTDGAVLAQAAPGVPVLVWGPGSPAQMHAVDEFLELTALEDASRMFRALVGRWS
ncbi:M20/M25/M40 family metallo-hydrolase [Arthrobacter sp. YD2]|uniref:M20 family metallopeptidase n=1 Tax=Arthrobacter sp. YD2 TaxID=3058046 RepID=UPI0025B566B0|nr:M20/M25/M40 family metallo-hydrolase [Arthrobacter sp. YD2]MDN3903333.1 M20/M25/M40 family metallo-hydrolase [Arthrobacter sp. YD2]